MKLQLSFKATKLKNIAGAFKGTSDPFAVITLLSNDRHATPVVLGQTEIMKNTLDPDFTKTFAIDYSLGTPINLLIKIYDHVSKGDNKPMGSARFEVGAVLGAKGNTKAKALPNGAGNIFCRIVEAQAVGSLNVKLSGVKLANTEGFLRKSDPFYQLTRKDLGPRGTEWNVVHRSKKIKNNLNPNWEEEELDLFTICNGDLDSKLLLGVYDHESNGKHVLMGQLEISVAGLVAGKGSSLKLRTPGDKVTGTLIIHKAELVGVEADESSLERATEQISLQESNEPTPSAPPMEFVPSVAVPAVYAPPPPPSTAASIITPTFADYVKGGCEMNLCVAIDFTGSNGNPRTPGTLHYIHQDGTFNDYENAIRAIGGTLADYDEDQKFPVWGFGAKYGGQIYHCFQCGPSVEAQGIDGVIEHYRATFRSGLVMSGPTDITEVVYTAAGFAKSAQEEAAKTGKQKYTILLILTDGSVTDVSRTVAALNQVSDSPLSIVIVGVGNADFSAMQFIDDQGSPNDIAQFVAFNRYKTDAVGLSRATLEEIPDQLVGYYTRNGIQPNASVTVEEEEIVVEAEEEEIVVDMDFTPSGQAVMVPGTGPVFVPGAY